MEKVNDFLKNMKILFVEDDELTRKQFQKLLGKIFVNITLQNNGLDAFLDFQEKNLKDNNYDLIISDIDMPKMNGIEFIEKVRTIDKEVPVIFVTAKSSANVLYKSIQIGISSFIPKPLNINNLIKEIRKSCEKMYFQDLINKKNIELEKKLFQIEKIKDKYQNDINSLRNQVTTLNTKLQNNPTTSIESNIDDNNKLDILKKKNEEIHKMIKMNKLLKVENETILMEKRKLEDRVERKDELITSYQEDIKRLKNRLK